MQKRGQQQALCYEQGRDGREQPPDGWGLRNDDHGGCKQESCDGAPQAGGDVAALKSLRRPVHASPRASRDLNHSAFNQGNGAGMMTVRLTFDVTEPETHLVRVTQVFPATDAPRRTFRMAAWVPGSYKIRDYGRNVQDMTARVGGKDKAVRQDGKDAWSVPGTAGQEVTLRYDVYARDLSVQGSHVTSDHAHLFAANLALYDDASRGQPHAVTIKAPKSWTTWCGLESDAFDGKLRPADDYDHLIDCPIEVGPAEDYVVETFTVRRKKHRLVFYHPPGDMDRTRIAKDVRAVVEETAKLFGGLPYEHYTFITHVAADHGGGLEHRNSTVLGVDPISVVSDEKIQTSFLPLVAHEFFHTWNVKRILPASFQPYDLQAEVYTDLLWLFEGFTTYYELPILRRAGVVDDENFGKIAAEMLKYYEMALGRKRRSVAECSRLTWSLLYQPHEHNINRNVSYYSKGLFVGLCLDAHLCTHGVKDGLDVVMRHLWSEYGAKGRGVPDDAFPQIVKEAAGQDVGALLGRWVNGTTELPVDKAFKDLGFAVERKLDDDKKPAGLGVMFKNGSATIERIPEDSPCWKVLQPDDEIIAVEDYKWKPERFAEIANIRGTDGRVKLTVFREGRLRTFDVPLREKVKDKITIKVHKGDAAATRRRKAWSGL